MIEIDANIAADADTNDRDISDRSAKSAYLKRAPLSDGQRAELVSHAERTGVGAMQLLRGMRDKPAGLTAPVVGNWLNGKAQTAVPAHVDYMLAKWSTLPSNIRIALTSDLRAALIAEIERTGKGPVQILKRATDVPDGLSHAMIQSWTSDRPKPGTVGEAHWAYVMARYRALPIGTSPSKLSGRILRSCQIEISESDLAELRHHRARTGIGSALLLRNVGDKPSGLTPAMISAWLSGEAKKATPDLVTYVLARYRAWP